MTKRKKGQNPFDEPKKSLALNHLIFALTKGKGYEDFFGDNCEF